MELIDTWNKINFGLPPTDIDLTAFVKESKTPLSKIKKSVAYNLFWGILVSLLNPILLIAIDEWLIKVGILLLLIFSLKLILDTFRLYQTINPILDPSNNLINELTYQRNVIQNWISIQQKIGLIGYPFSIAVGFLIGGFSASKLSVIELLNKNINVLWLGGSIIVLTPICYYLVKWMLNYTYKKDLIALDNLISTLEDISKR